MPDQEPDVVVVGYIPQSWDYDPKDYGSGGGGGGNGGSGGPHYGDTENAEGGTIFVGNMQPHRPPEEIDEDEIRVDLDISREMTPAEERAVSHFIAKVKETAKTVFALDDNKKMILANGREVTAAELKAIMLKLDFKIDDVGAAYANQTDRGQADYNNGDPLVTLNIRTIEDYDKSSSGAMNFLVFHEVGHMSYAGRDHNIEMQSGGVTPAENAFNETIANDVARALARSGEHTVYQGEGIDYSTSATDFFL